MKTILVVEDEAPVRDVLRFSLERAGYLVEGAASGRSAMRELDNYVPDLIVLDVGLPDVDGLELLHSWRREERTRAMPVIIVTGRGDERDRVNGLRAGADDYVTKPFAAAELLARVRAALRRTATGAARSSIVRFGALCIDLARREAIGGDNVHLTPLEYRVLENLARHPGTIVKQDALIREVWGPAQVGDTRSLRVCIRNLRGKLEPDPARPRHIITEAGLGYRLRVDETADS